jgi:hypothetical protein
MHEPIVVLSTGAVVLQAAHDLLDSLRVTGHRVTVDPEGNLAVDGADLHPDVIAAIDMQTSDLLALVAAEAVRHQVAGEAP